MYLNNGRLGMMFTKAQQTQAQQTQAQQTQAQQTKAQQTQAQQTQRALPPQRALKNMFSINQAKKKCGSCGGN